MTEDEALTQGYTLIKTAQDLDNIRNDLDGKYILMNDIDLSSYSNWDPIGDYDNSFSGILDGNGHVISDLTVDRFDMAYAGLFYAIDNTGEVKNLGIENAKSHADEDIGIIAGLNYGKISNVYTTGYVRGGGSPGGIVGTNRGTISQSYSLATIEGVRAGGLAGSNTYGGIISKCFFAGKINNPYNTDGALVGMNSNYGSGNGTIQDCIWDKEIAGIDRVTGVGSSYEGITQNVVGLTTAEMQDPANWAGWDTNIWDFSTYPPKLKWETQSTNPDDPSAVGAIRLQVGANASADANAIIFNTSFDLGDIDVDFSSSQSASNSLDGIDALLDRISKKRSEFGAIMNRLESVLNTQTSQIENLTASKSTIMDADIAQESADYVKNQILQQTTASLLAQAQSANNAVIMALIRG